MERDSGDIIDRWSIAKLKKERIGTEENKKEYLALNKGLDGVIAKHENIDWEQFSKMMLSINDHIWQLEAGLKSGKEELPNPHYILDSMNDKVLTRIGATTILIRNFNSLRVQLKNIINSIVGEGFQDVKRSHLSDIGE